MIGQGGLGMGRPIRGRRWTPPHRAGVPKFQMFQDLPDDGSVVNDRNDPHLAPAAGTDQGIYLTSIYELFRLLRKLFNVKIPLRKWNRDAVLLKTAPDGEVNV